MRRAHAIVVVVAAVVLLVGVFGRSWFWGTDEGGPEDNGQVAVLEVVYPADGSIFPPDFVAPTFLWRDDDSQADLWTIEIVGQQGGETLQFSCQGEPPPQGEIDKRCISETNEIYAPPSEDGPLRSWTPNAATWKQIQQACGGPGATVTIRRVRADRPNDIVSAAIDISVSDDPVGAPIFYRDVPLMPAQGEQGVIKPLAKDSLPLINWRLRDVSKQQSRIVMSDMPSCANCHTFSGDGTTLGMDIDGPDGDKGSYGLAPIRKNMVIENKDLITWNSFPDKPEGHKTIGFLSQVSPDGEYVVTTVNESVHVTNFTDYRFLQVFFPTRGILAYYSRRTGEMKALPGADDPEFVHCDPTWSPDGKHLVFARAKARNPYRDDGRKPKYANDPNEVQIQYDLYRIPFNDGQGGQPEPVAGASHNGVSNTFPKISPDGRWIVLVKCRNGQLMRPDGRLWIVPFEGGEAREMNCNTPLMNSWHSFSPSGRWMVFSSKCNTPYTQLFLTHVDEDGQDSPAILIPNSTAANRAANLPEFANIAYEDLVHIDVPAVDWRRPLNRGWAQVKEGNPQDAIALFRKSLGMNPNEARTHFCMGYAFDELGSFDRAIEHYSKAVEIDPAHVEARNNLAVVLQGQGRMAEAVEHLRQAVRIKPNYAPAHNSLANALESQGEMAEAVEHYQRAVRIKSDYTEAHYNLANALQRQGKTADAIERYRHVLGIRPDYAMAHYNLANILAKQGELDQGIEHYRQALRVQPELVAAHNNLGNALRMQGKLLEAIEHFQQAVHIRPQHASAQNNLAVALDALAAQYAEAGQFGQAVRTGLKAVDAASAAGNEDLARTLRARIELYRQVLRGQQ